MLLPSWQSNADDSDHIHKVSDLSTKTNAEPEIASKSHLIIFS
jgi:hypothetical protein